MKAVLCLFLLCGVACTASPVEKVVELMKDLKERALADGAAEQKIFNKYACWCENTSKRKAQDIVDGTNTLRALGQQILSLKGKVATLAAEIAELHKLEAENKNAQDDATEMRKKENADYMAETTETMQALAALENAVTVLSDNTFLQTNGASPALVQLDEAAWQRATAGLKKALSSESAGKLGLEKLEQVESFLDATEKSHAAVRDPASATIQGILKDQYDTMSSDLEDTTQTEATKNKEYEGFMDVKAKELSEMEATRAQKEAEKADTEALLAETTQEYDDVTAQKEADISFFDETTAGCKAKNKEWLIRKDMREQEVAGITEAIKILTSDEVRALFAKTIKPGFIQSAASFLQVDTSTSVDAQVEMTRMKAFKALTKVTTKTKSLRLASVAASVRSAKAGHFDAVIKEIDAMKVTLKEEEANDIKKRDTCKKEFLNIESTTSDLKWKIKKNDAKIKKLSTAIDKDEAEKEKTIAEIEDTQKEIDDMKATRIAENAEFKQGKEDDETAIEVLEKAKEALTKFYKKNAALVQKAPFEVSKDQAPDASFSGKGSNKNESKGIESLMELIIEDLHEEIAEAEKEEAEATKEWQAATKAAEKLKAELTEKKDNLEAAIAARTEERNEENVDKTSNQEDKKDEEDHLANIKPDCDWLLGAFEERVTKRAAEMDGLTTAKENLMGAVLLQTGKSSVDDAALDGIDFKHVTFLGKQQ
eukprot:gnl/TRDRNA2_/TRDRNA2_179992_c0_seq1.p1 gnl/TRDRNA2_/TRDRNA2_179992_c0~~gnl/TRDRNA2_/TRDRNA2_179992_c0_seq1.p1  ORF type:complete len:735 (+),score=276.75 gnl/TRDRNA2_/TRDRNA2_179992_c0_seq1:70-2205(+)